MIASYFRLNPPFTSVRATVCGGHTQLGLWVNHAKAGEICVRNEELPDVLLAFASNEVAVCRHGIGDGKTELIYQDDDVEPDTLLISEYGEITSGKNIEAIQLAGNAAAGPSPGRA